MSNNQIGDLIAAMTDLKVEFEGKRTAIANEIARLSGVVESHLISIDDATNKYIDDFQNVFVDTTAPEGQNGSRDTPFSSINEAIQAIGLGRRRFLTINLRVGQVHTIERYLQIEGHIIVQQWGEEAANSPRNLFSRGSEKEEIISRAPTLTVATYDEGERCYGLRYVRDCSLTLVNLYVNTPVLNDASTGTLETGLINRSEYIGTANFRSRGCYFDLGSPLHRTSSGTGQVNVDLHANIYDVERLTSSVRNYGYVFINESSKTIVSHFGIIGEGLNSTRADILGRMFSHRHFTSGDPSVQPCNILSNLNFSATAVPII